ncbi:MAG: amidase family protein [Pseudohaliea sp.]
MRRPFPALVAAALAAVCLPLLAFAGPPAAGSALQAVDSALARIARSDASYGAVIAVDAAAARAAAAAQDALAPAEREALPLGGEPVLLKDNIESRELPTTAGSLALAENRTGRDAPLVAQLRAAGAIVLGKTNLSEWANFRSYHSVSGWSAVGGQTVNAVDPRRSPCGSSSGSAVAVALGYVDIAIGTETSGSIVCPAAANGVVGVKPTHGLVAGAGIVPIAASQDTAGPITRDVALAARTLAAMLDPEAPGAAAVAAGLADVAGLADLGGVRIGVFANTTGYAAERDRELDAVLARARADGATVIPGLAIERYEGFRDDALAVLLYEFRRDLAAYLAGLPNAFAALTLEDLIAFNAGHPGRELRYFGQEIFLAARDLELDATGYETTRTRLRRLARQEGLDRLFAEAELDVLIGITEGPAWMIDPVNGDAFFGESMASLPAIAGNPHVTLPLGTVDGLPLGISLVGRRGEDHELLRIAHRLEALHRRGP